MYMYLKLYSYKYIYNIRAMDSIINPIPFVSICTPTFNRRPFIPFMIKCFEHQTYPKDRIEWIIIDDGTDPIEDLVKHIPQVKYFYYDDKMLLGKKRNIMHSKCKGDILIYMDDDDYYPPERISHGVTTLLNNPTYLIAGSSEMYVYFDTKKTIYRCGPYGKYHSTAATFIFKKELLEKTQFTETNALAEERDFLKNYTIPLVQLDSLKTIMVFSHAHNSLNKECLLENPAQTKTSATSLTVDDIISNDELKQFYMCDMNSALLNYDAGKPEHKPKLLEQIKKMNDERGKRRQDHNKLIEHKQSIAHATPPPMESVDIQQLRMMYEKKLADKNYLISELLKKVKELSSVK